MEYLKKPKILLFHIVNTEGVVSHGSPCVSAGFYLQAPYLSTGYGDCQ